MVSGLYSNYIENFQNTTVEEEDITIEEEEIEDNFQNTNMNNINMNNMNNINNMNMSNINLNNMNMSNITMPNMNNIIGEEEEINEEVIDEEEGFQNKSVEGFSVGKKIEYNKHKLFLKSILFGILFYLLSNPKVYKITKPYLKNIDAVIIHSLLFVGLHYFLNLVF
tara:strand:+ start:362 stop:862 length:501 start_codon:yes stop_codon:yes gene_type:complete